MEKNNKNKHQIFNCRFLNSKGVTLLELMVSVALFSVTILMASQIFRSVLDGQRLAISSQEMQESTRYSFERMSKEIRTAVKDKTGSCNSTPGKVYHIINGGTEIIFLNYKNQCMHFSVKNNRLMVKRNAECEQYFTPSNLVIKRGGFQKIDNSDYIQARVLMNFDMEISVKRMNKEKLLYQTIVSSRYYE